MTTGSSVIWNKTQNESFSPVLKGVSVVLSYLVVSEKAGWRQHTWSHWSIATLNITWIVPLGTRTRMWAIILWSLLTFNYKTEALEFTCFYSVSAVIAQWGQGEGWHDCLSPLRRRHQRLSQLRTSWKCVRFWIRTKEFTFFPFQILPLER